ncbi:TPA: hypothetical protein N0F65_003422 [Lagenidium giganteum]|uniref:NEDD8-activating enzyme E1 regulatory subunit n=1 Tax=Lagenidium giganteum TaxID=4803 RepID=A0AAV2YKZ7_9STRA|nr:TPA: hypothetical protein N0F65_003422 [Lagenidium giganteum]
MTDSKYDRQLRLWGADGQQRLASTHVLLVQANATGAETLKNLVLPGVQRFTILDDALVQSADVTNNFFVSHAHLNAPRAQVVTELLLEMNSDVSGSFRQADPRQVLQGEPSYFEQFDLIISTQLEADFMETLGELCWQKRIPLLLVASYGLLGYFRLQVPQHSIADAKNDPPIHELRLSRPFPALTEYAAGFDLEKLSSIEHAHVPFVVILLKAVDAWKARHGGQLPKTFPEKNEFKQLVKSMAHGPQGHEVNFEEAMDNAYKAYAPPIVPEEVSSVLATARTLTLTNETPSFWLLARGLADFVDANDGMLPITGIVPDMTASTDTYVTLQNLYVAKAKEDADQVRSHVQRHLAALQLPATYVTDVDAFCKNAYNIGVLETRSIAQEWKAADTSRVDLEEEHTTQSPLIWYFCLRAVAAFASEFRRYPGSNPAMVENDIEWVLQTAKTLAGKDSPVATWISGDHAMELTRSCEVELHNVAALMGGIASQEAIKIITQQFLPLNHTYVFNGITGTAATYEL